MEQSDQVCCENCGKVRRDNQRFSSVTTQCLSFLRDAGKIDESRSSARVCESCRCRIRFKATHDTLVRREVTGTQYEIENGTFTEAQETLVRLDALRLQCESFPAPPPQPPPRCLPSLPTPPSFPVLITPSPSRPPQNLSHTLPNYVQMPRYNRTTEYRNLNEMALERFGPSMLLNNPPPPRRPSEPEQEVKEEKPEESLRSIVRRSWMANALKRRSRQQT